MVIVAGMTVPRALTAQERDVILALLPRDDFADADVYRAQLVHTTVTDTCSCGCPSIFLTVDRSAARQATVEPTGLPVAGSVGDTQDLETFVDLSLIAKDGYLWKLEVSWYGESRPTELPDPSAISLGPVTRTDSSH